MPASFLPNQWSIHLHGSDWTKPRWWKQGISCDHAPMHRQELESHDFSQDPGDERTDEELSVCFLCWTFGRGVEMYSKTYFSHLVVRRQCYKTRSVSFFKRWCCPSRTGLSLAAWNSTVPAAALITFPFRPHAREAMESVYRVKSNRFGARTEPNKKLALQGVVVPKVPETVSVDS